MKEFAFIESLKKNGNSDGLTGIGDDAALVNGMLISKDIVVEGVHFTSGAPLADVIFRLFTANVSDIAAMGGVAEKALLGVAIPAGFDKTLLSEAILKACEFYNIELVGGDTTFSKGGFFASLTIIGKPSRHILKRSGAKEGDLVFISRKVGEASKLLEQELAGEPIYEHYRVQAELELGKLLGEFGVNSCIDISDGLGQDAGHIAKASKVKIEISPLLFPFGECSLSSGEEFALLFTVSADVSAELTKIIEQKLSRKVFHIGYVQKGEGVFYGEQDISKIGWEHS